MAKKPEKKTAQPDPGPVFLYGLDPKGKPRGARFPQLRDDIIKAAMDLGCRFVIDAPPAFAGLGVKLPMGRIYSSGKAFVPAIRRDLYDKLVEAGRDISKGAVVEHAPNGTDHDESGSKHATAAATAQATYTLPATWDAVTAGHLVIALDNPSDGYWPAVVLSREEDVLTMKWRDYPRQPSFHRHLRDIALVNPGLTN